MNMSHSFAGGSSTLNRPSRNQSKNDNSFPQQIPLPFTTSIMNNFKMSKERLGVKQNKNQQFPINNLSSKLDLEKCSKDSYEEDADKIKQKPSKNNKKIIGFSWSTITNYQKGKTSSNAKVKCHD